MLTQQDISKFQEIYNKHYGGELPTERLQDSATKLIRLIQILTTPAKTITNNLCKVLNFIFKKTYKIAAEQIRSWRSNQAVRAHLDNLS